MAEFLDENFLIPTKSAQRLYHDYAKDMPIIDYHCHLPPEQIAIDHRFDNLTQVWLYGDHYKWRAMRTNGVDESFCTGNKPDADKFGKWAETVPFTLRNPLYHWTHLELKRYFGVNRILNTKSAPEIYEHCNQQLQSPNFSVKNLLRKMNVATVCTTDDPVDDLRFHQHLKNEGFEIPVLPAFRADKAMQVHDVQGFNDYVDKLEAASGLSIISFSEFLTALKSRHDYFAANGCSVSDHGLEELYAEPFTEKQVSALFERLRLKQELTKDEKRVFASAMLHILAEWDHEKNWVQQYHLGALRNNNSRMMGLLGPDTGWDSIGDFSQARALSKFMDRLDRNDQLAKTILYNLNPADNELMATMIGNFNDGSVPGKIQFGSAWWFLDQKDGMTRQLDALSNMGLLSRFVGMLTDSRSFLSFPRHEYFRRLLCGLLGSEMENGELPNDTEWIGGMVQNICYYNAREYFGWQSLPARMDDKKMLG